MEPVKGGNLSALPENLENIFKAADPDASVSSWAIRYAASLEGIITVLSGMSNISQMQDNLSYMKAFSRCQRKKEKQCRKYKKVLASCQPSPVLPAHTA